MAKKIELLQLSPTMAEGTIVKWLKKEGDKISSGDEVAEVETDKAVMPLQAYDDGLLLKIVVGEGQQAKVGSMIAVVGAKGEDYSALLAGGNGGGTPAKAEPKKEEARPAGPPKVNLVPGPAPADKESAALKAMEAAAPGGRTFSSPLARKMAQEAGLDIARVKGSGPHGRVVKRDVESAIAGASAPGRSAAPAIAVEGDVDVPVSGMRKTIARRLVQSRQEVPSFTLSVEIDAEALLAGVAKVRDKYPDEKITVTHFLIKAMAIVSMRHDWIRTQWVDGKMVRRNHGSISVAVAIEDGLLTPVIRNAHAKGVAAIARELRELAGKARERRLTEADLTGGVQTLSNLGMFGIEKFDAIVNPPESSILAVGAVVEKPVVRDGKIVPGKTIGISLSCDHRVVDGAVGAAYLKDLKAALEEPLLLLV